MSKRYTKETFSESLDRRLSGFQADPWLAQRIIGASEGEKPVKKLSLGAILVIALLCILVTGAVAAALNGWNLNDFWNWQAENGESFLPPDYEQFIENENITAKTDHAVYTVGGAYFDGINLEVTVNVSPKEDVLPFDADISPDSLITEVFYTEPTTEEITLAQYARKHHGGYMAAVEGWAEEYNPESEAYEYSAGVVTAALNEDGSLSLYISGEMAEDDRPEREFRLKIRYQKMAVSENENGICLEPEGEKEEAVIPLTVHAAERQEYVCEEDVELPGVGVTMTKITMTATPLSVLCKMDMKITDPDLYKAQWGKHEAFVHEENLVTGEIREYTTAEPGSQVDFEFVYPEGKEAGTERKAVPTGIAGSDSMSGDMDMPYAGRVFQVEKTISVDALSDHYAIRAYNRITGERFETVEFTVKPAGK